MAESDLTRTRDRILRSYGILRYAEVMTSKEFLARFADVRLGASVGILPDLTLDTLDPLLANVMPASLICSYGEKAEQETERDLFRARTVKNALAGQQSK